jgi:gliding motility-associated protein GldC
MSAQNQSEITIHVTTDENKVPEKLAWQASDNDTGGAVKAVLLSVWDEKERNTLRVDLWTKEMTIEEMKHFVHQTMLTMSDTFERATGEEAMALSMRDFCEYFAEKMDLAPNQA